MWAQIVMAIMGVWLMTAPGIFGFNKAISDNAHIVGPLIATFSIIAISECTRNVRLFNFPLAVWLLAAPVILRYDNDTALMNDYVVSIIIIFLFLVKPRRKHRFGGGWPAVWRTNTLHQREPRQIRS
jgi:hypothetical protein